MPIHEFSSCLFVCRLIRHDDHLRRGAVPSFTIFRVQQKAIQQIKFNRTFMQVPWRSTAGEDHASITKLLVQADKIRWQKVTAKREARSKVQAVDQGPNLPHLSVRAERCHCCRRYTQERHATLGDFDLDTPAEWPEGCTNSTVP